MVFQTDSLYCPSTRRGKASDSLSSALDARKSRETSFPTARERTADTPFARRRRFAASFGALGVLILVLSLTFGRQTVETKRLVPKTATLADTTKQVVEEPQFAIAESPSNDRIAAPQLVDGTELSSEPETVEEDVASSEVSDVPKNVEIQTTASENQFVLRRQKINEVTIGSRTDGANPQGNDGSDESIFREVERLIYSFELAREDGSVSKVKLLRSIDWLDLETTRLRDRNSGREVSEIELIADRLISPELQEAALDEMALDVWLDLPEVGCVGWAELVDVDDSFEYREGVGNLVTGTFEHVANELLELTIEGDSKPITCTPNHPFWSVDREDFVEAGELLEGERLLVFNGETKRVVQKLPRPGPETVYNLEVFSEHVYRVAMDGALVHNLYAWQKSEIDAKSLIESKKRFSNVEDHKRHGKTGSTYPDVEFYDRFRRVKVYVEVKRYDFSRSRALSQLKSTLRTQLSNRAKNVEQGARQLLIVDVRDQKLSWSEIFKIKRELRKLMKEIDDVVPAKSLGRGGVYFMRDSFWNVLWW